MQYCSSNRFPLRLAMLELACLAGSLLVASPASAVVPVPTDLQVVIRTDNSPSNPGPFSRGDQAPIDARFRIDASVTPTGSGIGTWAGALDDLVLNVHDSGLGAFTIFGQDGRWRQLNGANGNGTFAFGGWGGSNDGSLSPFSVVNPALSATPFVLQSITFEFRGAALFPSLLELPGVLSYLPDPGPSDFSYLDLTLHFTNADPAVGSIPETTIIRNSAFKSVTVSPVPEPDTVALLLAGMLVVGGMTRRRTP